MSSHLKLRATLRLPQPRADLNAGSCSPSQALPQGPGSIWVLALHTELLPRNVLENGFHDPRIFSASLFLEDSSCPERGILVLATQLISHDRAVLLFIRRSLEWKTKVYSVWLSLKMGTMSWVSVGSVQPS